MEDTHRNNPALDVSTFIVLGVSLVFIALNILRIIYVPITHDEALTYSMYVSGPWLGIISMHPTSANDHILNSLFCKFFVGLFGNGQFSLRLTNLLAQVVYLYFSYRVLRQLLTDRVLIIACFLLLNLNPFLFEFWGLCRGYGLSIACMTGSVYFLLRYIRYHSESTLWYCLVMGMAAVYSNYSLLYFFLALPVVVAYSAWAGGSSRSAFMKELRPVLFTSFVLFLSVVGNMKALHDDQQLYYGGDTGIIHDTLATLLKESLYLGAGHGHLIVILSAVIVISIAATGTCFITAALRKRNAASAITGLSLYMLLVVPVLVIIVQHYLLAGKFLIERTALFLVPLFILQFTYAVSGMRKALSRPVFMALAIFAVFNFTRHINVTATRSWHSDARVLLVLNRMEQLSKGKGHRIRVRASWQAQPPMQYYISTQHKRLFEPVIYTKESLNADTSFDYYYAYYKDLKLIPASYHIDTEVPADSFMLFIK